MFDPKIKKLLGFKSQESDGQVLAKWKRASTRVCKPCWELKYCPYGPFVEQSPLLPLTRKEAEEEFSEVKPNEFPEDIPKEIAEMSCTVFGHICPVVFVAEGFTETSEPRRSGRYLPFKIRMRVVRRDNYTCQVCGTHLLDNEVEFDHIIPASKGGSSEESNIRLTCFKCNRDKKDLVEI